MCMCVCFVNVSIYERLPDTVSVVFTICKLERKLTLPFKYLGYTFVTTICSAWNRYKIVMSDLNASELGR